WVMGQLDNPQQFKDWQPDPKTDPFINPFSHAWRVRYFRNDPTFPKRPKKPFTNPVLNLGPDANEYRDRKTGKVMDADTTGVLVGTFTPHRSPLGLFFDVEGVLAEEFNKDGFVLSWTFGKTSVLMRPFTMQGADLMHLDLEYDEKVDNYRVRCRRIVEGFEGPTDAVMVGNDVYVIENSNDDAHIWKITLPAKAKKTQASTN
ncbi:MAG: cytochrome c class I, partial [Cyclobacteriaceae bacterium]|nr:cytochrome c class I [Cyclobacteriaceae bacterium]